MRTRVAAAILLAAVSVFPTIPFASESMPAMAWAQAAQDPAAKAQAAIDKGAAFLKSQQQPNGSWQQEKQPPAITALALRALARDPKTAGEPWVKKGYENLIANQLEDGGVYKDLLANYNTAIAISSLSAANNPEYKARIDKAVAYLRSLQWNDTIAAGPKGEQKIEVGNPWFGGFGYGSKSRPDGSNTQLALDALVDAGAKPDDPAIQAALKFVTRMQNRSESNDQPWAGNDGGAVYTPANKGESFAGEITDADGKRRLRSYGSMTYAVLKSYVYAGLAKEDPRVKAAWQWISSNWTLEENPGMREGNPEQSRHGMFYYYMTLARSLDLYNQPVITDPQGNKHDWRVELIDKIVSLQKPDGSWTGDNRWMEDNSVLATSYLMQALQDAMKDLKENPPK